MAEQIVIPQVVIGEQGEARPVEIVPANIDYDELAARIAEKVFPEEDYEEAVAEAAAEDAPQEAEPAAETAQEAETVVDAAAEEEIAEESGEPAEDDALADEIARKVSELSPNDFDIIVDDEGCRSLAEALVEKLDYDRILDKLNERAQAAKPPKRPRRTRSPLRTPPRKRLPRWTRWLSSSPKSWQTA